MNRPDATAVAAAVRSGALRAVDHARATLDAIDTANPGLNAYHEVFHEAALERAAAVDALIAAGRDPGPLAGVCVAVKDNIATTLGQTTCSSRMLEGYRSPFDATVVTRLVGAGAVIVGKTNMDEFAMGSSSETCAWGVVRNPHDPTRTPGGSSGGSAAAMAAGLCDLSLGSDTGGSIRQPAAFCGIVGLKPTYGRISRWGLVAFGSSLDQIGPFASTVRDAALAHGVMAGIDEHDSTSAAVTVDDWQATPATDPRTLRVGVPSQYLHNNDPAVTQALDHALTLLRSAGATLVDIDLPMTDHGISTYYVIAPAEASSNLARFDGIRYGHRAAQRAGEGLEELYARSRSEGFGPEVQRRIMLGTYVLSSGYYDAYYDRALRIRRLIKQEFDTAFAQCDVILGPTAPTAAFTIGGVTDPLQMYMNDVYTVNTNIAGIAGISLPGGVDRSSGHALPVGLQLQAPAFAESRLLRASELLERLLTA